MPRGTSAPGPHQAGATSARGTCRNTSSSGTDFAADAIASVIQNPDLPMAEKRALIAGAPFDRRGRSGAPMAFSMFEEQAGNAWVFAFHPFYGWNGCSNQAFAQRVSDTVFDVEEYFLCPIGAAPSGFL